VATEDGFGETAAVGIWIDAGSAYETQKNNGVAHFLEHMAFKGTSSRSKTQIETEVENLGAHFNAYTSREQTVYVTQSFKKDVPRMVDLLSDIIQRSELRDRDIDAERSIILREKESVEQNLDEVVFDHLHSAAFQGTSLGLTILGEISNIQSIKRDDLVDYIKTHYTAPRMVLVGSGAVNHDELVQLAEKHFGGLSSANNAPARTKRVPYTGSEIRVRSDDMELAHVAIGFESVGWSHPHYFTYLIVQALLGSYDHHHGAASLLASRLAETVDKEHLAESFQTFSTHYKTTGLFGVYGIAHPGEKFADFTFEILQEFQRTALYITPEELHRAKNKVKAALLSSLDGNMAVAEDIGRQMLTLSRRMTPAEVFMRVDSIQVSDVKEVLDKYFNDVCPSVVGLGPIAELPDYHYLRTWTYWDRL